MTIKLSTLVRDRDTEFTTLNFLTANNNLSDVNDTAASLGNLGLTASAAELNTMDGITATTIELNYVDGVTSAIQTQLDAKVIKTAADGSAIVPSGNTAARDGSPSAGYLRFNSESGSFEGYNGSEWGSIGGGLETQSVSTSNTDQTAIATYDAATIFGAKVFVLATSNSERYITEILMTHNGNTAVATEYGQVATDVALATYDVDISGGNVRILATPASAANTDFTTQAVTFT